MMSDACLGEGTTAGDGELRERRTDKPVPVDVRHGETSIEQGTGKGGPYPRDGKPCKVTEPVSKGLF